MTQYKYEALAPTDSGSTLLERLNGLVPALLTQHRGEARPDYVQPGMLWVSDAAATWVLCMFDGTSDVPLATIDPTTHQIVSASVPTTRKIKVGLGLTLGGVAGTDAAPVGGDLSADRLIGVNLAGLALASAVWTAGVSTTPAPIDPATLKSTIAARVPSIAWADFYYSGGAVVIRGSGGISSIVRNGVGDYTVTFSSAFPSANYSLGGTFSAPPATYYNWLGVLIHAATNSSQVGSTPTLKTAAQCRIAFDVDPLGAGSCVIHFIGG